MKPEATGSNRNSTNAGTYRPIPTPQLEPGASIYQLCAKAYITTFPRMKAEGTVHESRAVSML